MKFFSSSRFWLLLSLAILPLAINNGSLWLDEGDTAMYALEPGFSQWCQRLLHDTLADCQMPLGMLCAWVGGEILGTQEWQLRAINLLWGALALVAMSRVGRRLQIAWLPALLAIQPYFWFYLNEARPYALQLAGGAWLLLALVEFILVRGAGTAWAWHLALAAFFLLAATMLAPLPVAMVVMVGAIIAWRQGWRVDRRAWTVLAGGFLACVPLAIYYADTLLRGTKSSQMWSVDLKFVLYVFYELAGMGGIGLSGAEIRTLARSPQLAHELSLRLPQLILPVLLGALLAAVMIVGLRRTWCRENRSVVLAVILVPVLTALMFVAGSLVLHKAFWARHYAPIFPFYVTLLGLAVVGLASASPRWLRLLPALLAALLVYSALNFRFAPRLRKEDYRSAAAFARTALAKQQMVWWAAGGYSADYYGLNLAYGQPVPGRIFSTLLPKVDLGSLPPPSVIVLSRPDVHDPDGLIRRIIAENHFATAATYQGFIIWTNPAMR